MVKYCGHYVTFQEVPNEISLTFTITNCVHQCPGCHSSWLQGDIGDELTISDIKYYLKQYDGAITCICLMGTGNDPEALAKLLSDVKKLGYKVCLYAGEEFIDDIPAWKHLKMEDWPHYLKVGGYKEELGGLDKETTNQRFLKFDPQGFYIDITNVFWRRSYGNG